MQCFAISSSFKANFSIGEREKAGSQREDESGAINQWRDAGVEGWGRKVGEESKRQRDPWISFSGHKHSAMKKL